VDEFPALLSYAKTSNQRGTTHALFLKRISIYYAVTITFVFGHLVELGESSLYPIEKMLGSQPPPSDFS
jgi:hypothetical protein